MAVTRKRNSNGQCKGTEAFPTVGYSWVSHGWFETPLKVSLPYNLTFLLQRSKNSMNIQRLSGTCHRQHYSQATCRNSPNSDSSSAEWINMICCACVGICIFLCSLITTVLYICSLKLAWNSTISIDNIAQSQEWMHGYN